MAPMRFCRLRKFSIFLVVTIVFMQQHLATAFGQERVRKSIDEMPVSELLDYIHAVKKLREKSAADPSVMYSYAHMAGMHNRPTLFGGACEHWNYRFLAWHRALLYNYEDALRAADPPRTANVTIPYWHWTIAPTGKRFPVAFENDANAASTHYGQQIPAEALAALHRTNRNTSPSAPLYPWKEIARIATIPDMVAFAGPATNHGDLENPPHDTLHGFIGGDLVSTSTAANDPIFWSYHTFLDLVWWWRQSQISETPDCLDCPMRGMPVKTALDRALNPVVGQIPQLQHVYHTKQLGYTYEFNTSFVLASSQDTAPITETFSTRFPALAALALTKPDRIWELAATEISGTTGAAVELRKVSRSQTFAYIAFVYLHPADVPFEASDASFRDQYLVGHYSQWVNAHTEHAGHAEADHNVEIRFESDAYPKIKANRGGKNVVTVAIHVQAEVPNAQIMTTDDSRGAALQAETRIGAAAIRE